MKPHFYFSVTIPVACQYDAIAKPQYKIIYLIIKSTLKLIIILKAFSKVTFTTLSLKVIYNHAYGSNDGGGAL